MATNNVGALERMDEDEALLSISSHTSLSGGRLSRMDKCYVFTTLLCALTFPVLGTFILILGIFITHLNSNANVAGGAYVGGGTAEIILGACLVAKLSLQLCKLSRRRGREIANYILFVILTFAFLVWCAVAFSLCLAVVMNGLNYGGGWREATAMALSCISLVLVLVFGGTTCYWAGCPAD